MGRFIDDVLLVVVPVVAALLAWYLLAVVPVALYTSVSCLRQGYIESTVTVGLSRYCITITGAVRQE